MLTREGALRLVGDALGDRDIVVGTTGMLSRELFEYRYLCQPLLYLCIPIFHGNHGSTDGSLH